VVEEGRDESVRPLRTTAIMVAATLMRTAQLAREATISAPFPDSSLVTINPPAIFVSAISLIGSTRVVTTSSTGALSPCVFLCHNCNLYVAPD